MPINETPREYIHPEKPRNVSAVHQPVIICIDTSASMKNLDNDSMPKYKIVEKMINDLPNIDLPEYDRSNVDICILVFDNEVRTLVDWRSLDDFHGDIKLNDIDGTTCLGEAIVTAIDKTRERRHIYASQGIQSKRAQIFIYTDGVPTDDMNKAYKYSKEYLNRNQPTAKMYVILVPPANDTSELIDLGGAVGILMATDCKHGLPSSFKFMKGSIVASSQSSFGDTTRVRVPDEIKIYNRTGKEVKRDENGKRILEDRVDEWV